MENSYNTTTRMSKTFAGLWLFLLLCVALYIRVNGANDYYYNGDEAMHYNIASAATLSQLLDFARYEAHPPMLYILLHYWLKISHAPWFARSLSLVFGLATIIVYYQIGQKLANSFTGFCCAFMVAFSNAFIVQSYTIRHYSIFIFFLSSAFYFYICLRHTPKKSTLTYYICCAIAACLTHFSGIIPIFIIASYHSVILFFSKTALRRQAAWWVANMLVALVFYTTFYFWMPILLSNDSTKFASKYLLATVCYIPILLLSILPNPAGTLALLATLFFVVKQFFVKTDIQLKHFVLFTFIAIIAAILLNLLDIYNISGRTLYRRNLWIAPFILILYGWILADIVLFFLQDIRYSVQKYIPAMLIITGILLYSPQERFADNSEYIITKDEFPKIVDYFDTLDSKALVYMEKDDAELFGTMYGYLGKDAFMKHTMVKIVPYKHTFIVFNPYYGRIYNDDRFAAMLQEAKAKIPSSVERILFFNTQWTAGNWSPEKYLMRNLLRCPYITKEIVTFPANKQLNIEDLYESKYSAFLLIISKGDLFDKVLASDNKAHTCLKSE